MAQGIFSCGIQTLWLQRAGFRSCNALWHVCIARWVLNHWTTKEVCIYLIIYLYKYGLTSITLCFELSSNTLLFILFVKLFPVWPLGSF